MQALQICNACTLHSTIIMYKDPQAILDCALKNKKRFTKPIENKLGIVDYLFNTLSALKFAKLRNALESIGFENVKMHDFNLTCTDPDN
jgi:hypothetical protein